MTFQSALAFTLAQEGGYSDNPRDHGGSTNYGITQRTYDAWNTSHGMALQPVRDIDRDMVEAIYQASYWTPAHCAEMPDSIGTCVFDFAVNSGVHEAIMTLQRCLGTAPDGRWGAKTLALVQALDRDAETALVASYLDARRDFYQDIVERNPGEHVFLTGWLRRIDALQAAVST